MKNLCLKSAKTYLDVLLQDIAVPLTQPFEPAALEELFYIRHLATLVARDQARGTPQVHVALAEELHHLRLVQPVDSYLSE